MNKITVFIAPFVLLAGFNAFAGTILTCTQNGDATKEMLVLSSQEAGNSTLEVIDPSALKPLAHLKLWANTVNQAGRIISVDHWESMTGAVQLIAVFDAGAFKSKHVYFDAQYRRDTDNHGSYGMLRLTALSTAGIKWVCEEP